MLYPRTYAGPCVSKFFAGASTALWQWKERASTCFNLVGHCPAPLSCRNRSHLEPLGQITIDPIMATRRTRTLQRFHSSFQWSAPRLYTLFLIPGVLHWWMNTVLGVLALPLTNSRISLELTLHCSQAETTQKSN